MSNSMHMADNSTSSTTSMNMKGDDASMPGMMMGSFMMHMTFYQSNELTILFKGFDSNGSNG